MQSPIQDGAKYQPPLHSHAHGGLPGEDFPTPRSTELENVLEADGQTFAGEISMSPAFQDVDEGLGHAVNSTSKSIPKIPSGQSFSNPATSGDKGSRKVRGWLESVLNQHGVVANEEEWRRYLAIFMDEIHILYPILHRPTVWETFNELWEYSALWSMSNSADREQKRMSVALICFCLALGRCSVSTRMTDANGVHSAGWSLYSVGLALMQDTMEMSNNAAKSLVTMQILLLRVRVSSYIPFSAQLLTICRSCICSAWTPPNERSEFTRCSFPTRTLLVCTDRALTTRCRYFGPRCTAEPGGPFTS